MNSTTKITKKFGNLTRDWTQITCLSVRHLNHYTRMFSVLVWGCNWNLFMHGWFCPIRLIYLIGPKSFHFEKKLECKFLLHTNVSEEAWIGAWANSTTNAIEFTDGSTFDYTPSPLNAGHVSQSCIAIHRNYSTGRDCNERKRFICVSSPLQLNGS